MTINTHIVMSEVNAPTEKVSVTVPESQTPPLRKDTGPVIGGLRLRSAPGACLLFAGVLLIVGIGIAVGGYWNSHPRRQAHNLTGRTASEKLKLIGPVIMGVGLFIFICANTILYENRDRELHQETEQGRDQENQDILPLVFQSRRHSSSNSKWFSQTESNANTHTLNLSELNIHCLDEGVDLPTFKCSSPSSCNSSQVNLDTRSSFQDHRNMETFTLPVIKLNDCLIGSSDPEAPPLPARTYRNKVGLKNVGVEATQVNSSDTSLMMKSQAECKQW